MSQEPPRAGRVTRTQRRLRREAYADADAFAPRDADAPRDGDAPQVGASPDPSMADSQSAFAARQTQPYAPRPEPTYQMPLYPQAAPRPRAYMHPSAPRPRDDSRWGAGDAPPPRKKQHTLLYATVIIVCVLSLVGMGLLAAQAYQAYPAFRLKVASAMGDVYAPGVYVDDRAIGGLTRAQAEEYLSYNEQYQDQFFALTVQVDDTVYQITQNEVPLSRNTQAVLDEAYVVGRQGTTLTLGTGTTPFEMRYQHMRTVAQTGAYYYTKVSYNPADVRAVVGGIASLVNREPVNAMIASFDFATKQCTFTKDTPGALLDSDKLYKLVVDAMDKKNYGAVISVKTKTLLPEVTRAELMNNFGRISSFTTSTTADQNRNNNINLAAQAINRVAVNAGETFSFNATTGERTEKKGYQLAGAIANGMTVDDIGGGVCQVSSTLFNAVALADLDIVTRSPHAWPSSYVDKGRDATVDWPNLDFKFRNNQKTPVFIVAYYANRKLTIEIYGMSLGTGVTVDLLTVTTSTTKPGDPVYQRNPLLPAGTQQELKKARTGYTVDTYRVYKRNGAEYKRTLLCKSTYKPIDKVIEYNE